jgi:hypothetical protein
LESSASARRVASAVLDPRRWQALALLSGAFFMALLDGTITIVALPSTGAGLRFSEQGLQWRYLADGCGPAAASAILSVTDFRCFER